MGRRQSLKLGEKENYRLQNVSPCGVADYLISRQPAFFSSRAAHRCCSTGASRSEPEVHRGSPALQLAREIWYRCFLFRDLLKPLWGPLLALRGCRKAAECAYGRCRRRGGHSYVLATVEG